MLFSFNVESTETGLQPSTSHTCRVLVTNLDACGTLPVDKRSDQSQFVMTETADLSRAAETQQQCQGSIRA